MFSPALRNLHLFFCLVRDAGIAIRKENQSSKSNAEKAGARCEIAKAEAVVSGLKPKTPLRRTLEMSDSKEKAAVMKCKQKANGEWGMWAKQTY